MMGRIRKHLTYANVMATILAFIIVACFALATPSESATTDVRPKSGQYRGTTQQDLPMQFKVDRNRTGNYKVIKNVYYKLRFPRRCGSRSLWFPSNPRLSLTDGYGPGKIRSNGSFKIVSSTGRVGTKGEFVSRRKAKGWVLGGLQCSGGEIVWKKVDFRAHHR
jgi:hypothetical protein